MSAPIVFAVAKPGVTFAAQASFVEAAMLMNELNADERLWTYYSRNLWLLCARELAVAMQLSGLDFTDGQCVALQGDDLVQASATLSSMIAALKSGTAPLDQLDAVRSSYLGQFPPGDGDFEPLTAGDDQGDTSPRISAETFYHYLGSMKLVADQAIRSKRPFFWACLNEY